MKEVDWCEGEDKSSRRSRYTNKTKWLMSISANCIVVVTTSIIAFLLRDVGGVDVLTLTGEVDSGLPAWQLPWRFNRDYSADNTTYHDISDTREPFSIAGDLGLGLAMIPLVSILQHLAIAKHYAGNKKMAASQEMIALGCCQFIGSFTGSPPITASFGRSAVNATSGVRTPFGGVITGIIIILTCAFLSPFLAFIPTSALSAVIIFAMFFTIDYSLPVKLWRGKKVDLIPYSLTFLIGLLYSVEMGLIAGTLVHILILTYTTSSPDIKIQSTSSHTIFSFQSSLFFPARDHIVRFINHSLPSDDDQQRTVVLDMTLVKSIDYTAALGISGLTKDLKKKSYSVVVCCANSSVLQVLSSADDTDLPHYDSLDNALTDNNC